MNRHIIYKIMALLAWIMSLLSCTADLPATDTPLAGEGEGVLQLSVPLTRSLPTTVGEPGSQDATDDERRITSLWFLAYPDGDGETLVKKLDTDELTHDYKTFSIKMKYGTYHIYVVANVPQLTAGTTEEELKAIILQYKDGDAVSLPSPTSTYGLPMVYQREEDYTLSSTSAPNILADLVYTCVKVRYTLVFDNTGISNAFGTNVLKIDRVSVRNIADRAPLLLPGTVISTDLTLFDHTSEVFNGMYQVGAYNASNPDDYTFSKPTINNTEAKQWAYRGTFYLPEHYVTAETQADQTQMLIAATLNTAEGVSRATLEYTIELGDTQGQTDAVGGKVRQLPRGRYYDITGRITGLGNKIEATAAVQDWTLQTVDAELNGPYYLYVAQTSVALEAGKDVTVACRTDAPSLSYESPTYSLNGQDIPIYEVEFNPDETSACTSFTVRIHPNMPPVADAETIEGIAKYFYIVAGDLKKKIDVSQLLLAPYLIVTPQNYTVYIKEVSNLTTYAVTYTYRTNLPRIQVATDKDIANLSTAADSTTFTATKAYNGTVNEGTGTLVCTLDQPHVSGNFPNANTATYTFTATGYGKELTESATLQIIPNATSYRLHFRPLTDDWSNPHIYVYQPLYTPGGVEVEIPNSSNVYEGENAILYGFTGRITFLGWSGQGGSVSLPLPTNLYNGKYRVGTEYDPNNKNTSIYNIDIDYCRDFRKDCCASAVNRKWPGVKMKKDTENPGWYYFDLPLLAEPGTALIMFADGHESDDKDVQHRYPAHMVPGIPLYNFADKDGWFLYDYTQGDKNEFVDDKPNILDKTDYLPDGTYRIWCKTNYTHIHIWIPNGADYTNWNDNSGLLTDAGNGYKYFDLNVSSSWKPSGTINYILHTGDSKTGDLPIYSSQWRTVTGKDYDYEVYL
ncbi:fimbrial protein [Mediterranea massiliensis]|uniref:fimbrial protein n=1 Tax=Mediterranea massiliensis TaxID=1841865 RepID=UPI0025A38B1C|nr:fimbrial protein [Mediterranea massiliensis]MDM8336718.1 fimbrial protein [Mediterranea massiliensis]